MIEVMSYLGRGLLYVLVAILLFVVCTAFIYGLAYIYGRGVTDGKMSAFEKSQGDDNDATGE